MSAAELVKEAKLLGIVLEMEGGKLVAKGKSSAMSSDFRASLAERKGEIIRLLGGIGVGTWEERRFSNQEVMTPDGPGKLWQDFETRVSVVLNGLPGRVTFYDPKDVR